MSQSCASFWRNFGNDLGESPVPEGFEYFQRDENRDTGSKRQAEVVRVQWTEAKQSARGGPQERHGEHSGMSG
jgi:hypothetical protein